MSLKRILLFSVFLFPFISIAQESTQLTIDRIFASPEFGQERFGPMQWFDGGDSYTTLKSSSTVRGGQDIVRFHIPTQEENVIVRAEELTPSGGAQPLRIASYSWSEDQRFLLIFTNTRRVWRSNTKGDYWIFDTRDRSLQQLGANLPEASLMFAKFSPDNRQVAYVSDFNLYTEDLTTGVVRQLTTDGSIDLINGTFDWVYEEEFFCRDGFRWSPDGKHIAYWQVDASEIRDFFMINNTDSVYSRIIPVQYPKVGQDPSSVRVGVVDVASAGTKWLQIPGDPKQHYLPRLQWHRDQVIVQQLDRKQQNLNWWMCDPATGQARRIYSEKDDAWVDIMSLDLTARFAGRDMHDIPVTDRGNSLIRETEMDGWRHLYKIPLNSPRSTPRLLTTGSFDIGATYLIAEELGIAYFSASPVDATQRYLYSVRLDGSEPERRLTPEDFPGVNGYDIAPNGRYAIHTHSNANTPTTLHLISLPDHQLIRTVVANETYKAKIESLDLPDVEFFRITTADGVEMDGRMIKPRDFDPEKKYPVLFHVYGEPAGQTATDSWGSLWYYLLAQKGMVIITMDNRGTPTLKGREWRKSIYRKIGVINSRDQAMATREILKWDFIDSTRAAVWGWSGGGSMTLNLLFRYPGLYKAGMSVAPVSNQLYYDNIYQERYMGLPSENKEDFLEGSPITYAKNLEDKLLLIHGTADDNVHYQNAEAVVNELIRHNKQFRFMAYPNRSHGIYEGYNTTRHLYTLLTEFLEEQLLGN